jgi:cyclophilin family peptidyl-prolyl cis-trans isomerase
MRKTKRISKMACWVAVACGLAAMDARAQSPGPGQTGALGGGGGAGDPKADFDDAFGKLKKLMADLTVLQAQYQQPKADKPALEAKFNAVKVEAQAAGDRLEAAALGLLAVDPKNQDALQIAKAVVAGSLETDDPDKSLVIASKVGDANAADAEVSLMAASAAMLLSKVDAVEAWLAKAKAAGAPADALSGIEQALARERPKIAAEMAKRTAEAEADDLPRVKFSTSAGDVVVELYENEAPNAVANFISLVEKGFYDGTPFHRVIPGFMAQGGDPTGTGTGGPGYVIACECEKPGARMHFRGTLSMAHAGKDTGGSQFFLTFRPTEHLDGKHTVFGRVIAGDDVLGKLARTQDGEGQPVPGAVPDKIVKAEVVRKRDHAYVPQTLPDPRR